MSAELVPFDVMHVVRLRGVLGRDAVVEILDRPQDEVDAVIAGLVDDGTMFLREGRRVSGYVLTEEGRDTHAALLAAQRDPALDHQLDQVYDAFLDHNPRVKTLCAKWQQVGSDEAARWQAVGDLEDLHASADLVFVHAGELVPRFTRYSGRLKAAVDRVVAGEEPYFTSPLVDSYHTVWFEAHEDFILTLGRDRAQEGELLMQATRARGVLRFEEGDPTDLAFLGGKGASLVRMRSLGLPVPPGIVVGTPACARYEEVGSLPDDIWAEILEQLHEVELEVGRSLGDAERPLLLSVRSGAPVSMPGMMDTILDIGLCARTLPGVAALAGDIFAWDTYARLVRMFGQTVSDIPSRDFESARLAARTTVGKTPPRVLAQEYLAVFEAATGRPFPDEPLDQLREAVEAVFRSWQAPRAQRYRAYAGISESLGTAVVVQAMVFGNMDSRSGTGVAFTRDPAIGAPGLYGDFLLRAQGEDVVAGHQDPSDIDEFRRLLPEAFGGLLAASPVLERSYGDMCDIEFTVEHGRFWLLQARRGQRTAHAAVRIALDLVEEGLVDLDTAVRRIPPSSLIRIRDPRLDDSVDRVVLGAGLAASPGSAVGRVALSAAAAERMAEDGHDVILVRPYTSPDDISGFIAARGIVTIHGGRTSHAAVVARGMDRPAVCGVTGLTIGDGVARFPGGEVAEGDEISVDGSSGQVFLGRLPLVPALEDPRVATLLQKADASRSLPVLVEGDPQPWADGVLPSEGTSVVSSVKELDDAADDRDVLRVVLDLGAAADPVALLAHAESVVAEGEPAVLVLVDDRWPTTVRSLPRIAWAGLVAGRQGDWTARLLAALMTEAS